LGRSKLGLMYQEVCYSSIWNGIIKDMKVDPRNKWRKIVSLKSRHKLDRCCYWSLMEKLNTSSIYWDLRLQKFQI